MVERYVSLDKSGVCRSAATMGGAISSSNIGTFGRRRIKSIARISCAL